jgi:catechol 2,3-dioxygenase-like lactoylglutathione lyase family enzyme
MDMETRGLGSRKLAQVAIVVKDIEAAIKTWAEMLGVPAPQIITTKPGAEVNGQYRGEPTNDQAKLAFFDMGGVQLELIEPLGTQSAWYEGLEKRGEGVHHLAFWTDDMRQSKAYLDDQGSPLIHRGDMGEGQYCYFDTTAKVGTMIELLERERTALE